MAQLRRHQTEFAALQTDIVTISFEAAWRAEIWLEETGSPFPLWLDPDRTAYHAFGLQRSFWRSWGPKNLWYYARRLGRNGRKPIKGKTDTHQLGGDFILEPDGKVLLAYRSHDPTDRPAVRLLLDALENGRSTT